MKPKFIFWDDIKKPSRYNEIIPDRKLGMIILALYDRIKNNSLGKFFKHSDIEDIYWEVNLTIDRKQREHARNAIEGLKHYFLTYDSIRDDYHLRNYAYEFGNMVYTLLEARFNPTQVEELCETLRESLHKHIAEGTFKRWHRDIFEVNHSALRR